jgi:hypothetical protein
MIMLLAVMAPLAVLAGPDAQPLVEKRPAVLADCAPLNDNQLEGIRGRYGAYYFGMDIVVNMTGSGPVVSITPHPNMPPGTVATSTGIVYESGNVSYRAGIGPQSVYQGVQVRGDNNIVTGVVNLEIMAPKAMLRGAASTPVIPRPSVFGMSR